MSAADKILDTALQLAAKTGWEQLTLQQIAAALHISLAERDPHPQLYTRTLSLMDAMAGGADWLGDYLRWELLLLDELGFGLDLTRCALTGTRDDLAFVSPRTGRAVSRCPLIRPGAFCESPPPGGSSC